jgi:hypothetical protein
MTEPTITCPKCRTELKLTESLAAPLIEAARVQYQQKLAAKETEVARREASIREQQVELARARESLEESVNARLKIEREAIAAEESKKAKLLLGLDLEQKTRAITELNEILADRDSKLAEAQKVQAELLRKQRELDDAKREFDLSVETRVHEALNAVRDKAKQEAEQRLKLKVLEKEEQIASMQRQIEELKRKAEQGSQQLQGEAQELQLEALIRTNFPRDVVEPVPKGEFGGDVLQRVMSAAGQTCGTILWEAKQTKKWSNAWLAKLRDDQRAARADVALIVTNALPEDVETFNVRDGVWVTERRCAIPVAIALRSSLIELAAARLAGEGQRTKSELVYRYLTGPRFRHRIEAIVEKFSDMQADLDKERKLMTRMWAKREEQLRGVLESTAGMYGDLQGIAGSTLREIEALDIPLLESSTS